MKTSLLMLFLGCLASLPAADPDKPLYWSAAQTKDAVKKLPAKVNPERHLATERFIDSAFIAYRDGNGEAELHEKQADLLFFQEGEGIVVVGGKMINGKSTAPGEQRGTAIEGGTKYPVAAGDTLYIPPNTVHQFVVEPGKHFTATVVKVTPKL
jgi:mannose-6-phosphate isomerase-like protein (cupin superfamily)